MIRRTVFIFFETVCLHRVRHKMRRRGGVLVKVWQL